MPQDWNPLKGRFDMAKYWNNDQGITSLGVSASISRVVNQSAFPVREHDG